MKVDKTPLPGIGMRKDIVTSSGRRIGTVTQRDGETALIISRQDDPDACLVSIPLTADEAATLGNLLGALATAGLPERRGQALEDASAGPKGLAGEAPAEHSHPA